MAMIKFETKDKNDSTWYFAKQSVAFLETSQFSHIDYDVDEKRITNPNFEISMFCVSGVPGGEKNFVAHYLNKVERDKGMERLLVALGIEVPQALKLDTF